MSDSMDAILAEAAAAKHAELASLDDLDDETLLALAGAEFEPDPLSDGLGCQAI
jgi:hypothetical protein